MLNWLGVIGWVGPIIRVDSFFLKLFRIHRMGWDSDDRVFVLFAKLARMGRNKDFSGSVFLVCWPESGGLIICAAGQDLEHGAG